MLVNLFNKDKIWNDCLREAAEELAKELAEEKAKELAEEKAEKKAKLMVAEAVAEEKARANKEREEQDKATAVALKKMGVDELKIAEIVRRNVDVVKKWLVASVL